MITGKEVVVMSREKLLDVLKRPDLDTAMKKQVISLYREEQNRSPAKAPKGTYSKKGEYKPAPDTTGKRKKNFNSAGLKSGGKFSENFKLGKELAAKNSASMASSGNETETKVETSVGPSKEQMGQIDKTSKALFGDSKKQIEDYKKSGTKDIKKFKDLSNKSAALKTKAYQGAIDNKEKHAEELEARYNEKKAIVEQYTDKYDRALGEWNRSKVLPMRALAKQSQGSFVAGAIAQAIATIRGDDKTLDRLQKTMDDRIERDIASQVVEIQQKGTKAKNIMSMMKILVPDDPESIKDQMREVYNSVQQLELNKALTAQNNPEMQAKLITMKQQLDLKAQDLTAKHEGRKQKYVEGMVKNLSSKRTDTIKSKGKGGLVGLTPRKLGDTNRINGNFEKLATIRSIMKDIGGKDPMGDLALMFDKKFSSWFGYNTTTKRKLLSFVNKAIKAEKGTQTEGDMERIKEELEGGFWNSYEYLRDAFNDYQKSALRALQSDLDLNFLTPRERKLLGVFNAENATNKAKFKHLE